MQKFGVVADFVLQICLASSDKNFNFLLKRQGFCSTLSLSIIIYKSQKERPDSADVFVFYDDP